MKIYNKNANDNDSKIQQNYFNRVKQNHSDRYGYVFMMINNITGCVYIGSSKNLNNFNYYLGFSPQLNNDFKRYGKGNFEKKILCYANNPTELEYYAILELMRARRDYGYEKIYNKAISLGGSQRIHSVIGQVLSVLGISYDELFNDAGKVYQLLLDNRNEMLEVIGTIYQ